MSTENKNSVTKNQCLFSQREAVAFADATDVDNKDNNTFQIVGYSGDILKHWFWGSMAIDLKGVKFAKKAIPILADHDRGQRVGVTTKKNISDNIVVEGRFMRNNVAQEIKADLQDGYPMEASVFIEPSIVEVIKEGESAEVNGHKLKGPGNIFRKGTIKEISMCTFGVDSNTSSQALSSENGASEKIEFSILEENTMSKEITKETFEADYPDIHKAVFLEGKTDGERNERELFKELKALCGGDVELLVLCYEQGKTKEETLKLRAEKLETANAELKAKNEELAKAKPETKLEDKRIDSIEQEFTAPEHEDEETKPEIKLTGEAAWKKEYAESAELQKEFRTERSYLAFRKYDEKGNIHILSRKKTKSLNG